MAAPLPTAKSNRNTNIWKLDRFGMTSRSDGAYYFVPRIEVARVFIETTPGQEVRFSGHISYGGRPSASDYTFERLTTGGVRFGCKHFTATEAKKLKKWAGAR